MSDDQHGLRDLIDKNPLGGYQLAVIAMCALIAMLDGFDTQAIAFIAPAMAAEWGVPVSAFGPVFAIGLLGGLLGALVFGTVADRLGRRPAILSAVAVVALGSLATSLSRDLISLTVLRFLTGLGLGGAVPCIIAMTAEYAPARLRATLVTGMFCGFPLGAVIGAVACAKLLAANGWPMVFLVGGLLPLLLLPLIFFGIPESLSWLSLRRRPQAITKILARMGRSPLWNGQLESAGTPAPRVSLAHLFAEGRTTATLLIWTTFFLSLLLVYLLVSWIPALAIENGRSAREGVMAAATLNICGIIGSLSIGRASDRFNAFSAVSGAYCVGAAGIFGMSLWAGLGAGIFLFSAIAGFFCIGAQMCAIAIASNFYPIEIRARGVGSAVGVGRLGAIIGPLLGSLFVGAGDGHHALLVLLAILSLAAGIAVFGIGLMVRGKKADLPPIQLPEAG